MGVLAAVSFSASARSAEPVAWGGEGDAERAARGRVSANLEPLIAAYGAFSDHLAP